MKLADLANKTIKNIFYHDEVGEIGIQEDAKPFHLIEQGTIFLELQDNTLLELANADEGGGITATQIDASLIETLQNNKIEKDNYWSQLSNKTIFQVKTYSDFFLISRKKETLKKEVISTIELIFKNGERIFISNAGYVEKGEIEALTNDFIVYKKREVGFSYDLLKE